MRVLEALGGGGREGRVADQMTRNKEWRGVQVGATERDWADYSVCGRWRRGVACRVGGFSFGDHGTRVLEAMGQPSEGYTGLPPRLP